MKRIPVLTMLTALVALWTVAVFGGVPQLVNFQGILRDGSGNPVANGSYSVLFKIYDDSTGGNVLWSETQTVNTNTGLFNVILGSTNPPFNEIPDSAFGNTGGGLAHWLGIKVGADPEMTPRQKLVSVGYGYRSEHVNTVDGAAGGSISSPLSFGNSSTPELYIYESGTSNSTRPIISHSPAYSDWGLAYNDVNDRFVFQSAGNPVMTVHLGFGRVGIGSISPQNKLDVLVDTTSSGVVRAVYGSATNNSSADPIGAIGGYFSGIRSGGEGYGVYGSGGRYGVFGTGYAGVRGEGTYGVGGEGSYSGVDGRGGTVGVLGLATNNNGYGIYGSNSGNPFTYAGYFSGDVYVNGTLGKAGGGFKIDHPVDPANKYLEHSFVESPDMKNMYDGVVTTDAKGDAAITLPEWFGALNRDFRYQLTVIGQFAQAIVSKEIANNQFSIETNKPNVKVSWQVTGIRQDAWANAHRIPVEQAKVGNERGFYIHPELFGQPEEKSVDWANHSELMREMKAKRLPTEQK